MSGFGRALGRSPLKWLPLWVLAALLGWLIAAQFGAGLLHEGHAGQAQPLRQASAAELLAGNSSDWRVVRLLGIADIVVIEFPGLAEQGAAMNRLAALVEKAGAPRDRLLDDAQLQQLMAHSRDNAQTFYQGHDYRSAALARFFQMARQQRLALNPQEQRLFQMLVGAGMLSDGPDAVVATGEQVLISFSATQPDDPATPMDESLDLRRRESVLYHELSHGEFFTSAAYREHCWRFWRERLSEAERQMLRSYLGQLDYDQNDEELVVNETQALLMHTPDVRAFNADSLGISDAALADLRERFRLGMPRLGIDSSIVGRRSSATGAWAASSPGS